MADSERQFQTEEQVRSFLRAPETPQPVAGAMPFGALPPIANLPLAVRAATEGRVDRMLREDAREGVPLQVNPPRTVSPASALGNVSPWMRFQTARRQNLQDQQDYLESQIGKGKVRKAKNSDDFILEIPDPETGKPRDVLLNEQQITLGDLAALAAHAPEIATTILTMAGTEGLGLIAKAPGAIRTAGQIISGAVGQKLGEAGQQIETRLEQGTPPDVGGTLLQKAKEVPGQAVMDTATLGAFKFASGASRLARGGAGIWETALQKEGKAAARQLETKYGPKLSYAASEASGSPLFAFLEAYTAAKPQSAHLMEQFKQAQLRESEVMANALTARTGTDEVVGNELLSALQLIRSQKEGALNKIRATMTQKESDALTKAIGKVSDVKQPFRPSEEGENFRQAYHGIFGSVKGKVSGAYQDAYSVPGATVADVPTKAFTDEIKFLMDQFPTTEGTQWLRQYAAQIPEKEAYRDIVQRRADLWNKINEAPADRSTKDYIHGQLSKSMTDTLDDASKNIINPAFRSKIQAANKIYKEEELPFYQKGLHDVLLKAGVPGSPENIELLKRFQKNTDLYRRLVSVAGKDSDPVKIVKSSILDGLLTKSGTSAIDPQFIDAAQFIKNLKELKSGSDTREMFDDVFGKAGDKLLEQGKILRAIQGSIPKEEAAALLKGTGPKSSLRRLDAVMKEQDQLNKTYTNTILDGRTDLATVNPEEFINRFIPNATESQLKFVANSMRSTPGLYEKVQDKLVEQILGKAGTFETWNKSNIERVLNDPKLAPKYREILKDKFDDIAQFAKALGPRQYAQELAAGTGMLVKGESIGALSKLFNPNSKHGVVTGLVREIPAWIGWKMTSRVLTNPSFREWAAKSLPEEYPNLVKAAILSEPVLEDMSTSRGSPDVIKDVVLSLRNYVNRVSEVRPPMPDRQMRNTEELRQFLRQP